MPYNPENPTMEYGLTKKEPISMCLDSKLHHELDAMQQLAANPSIDMPLKIHECRKHIKKTRSVVRMIKPAINKDTWKMLNPALRNSGKALRELRELDAHLECIANLMEKTDKTTGKDSLQAIYTHLNKMYAYDLTQSEDALYKSITSAVSAQLLLKELNYKAITIDILLKGISLSYRRCRRLCRSLNTDSPTTSLHEWRKCAKDLRYQIAAIAEAWPAMLNTLESEIHTLTDFLGRAHDLALLMNLLKDRESNGDLAHDCAVVMPLIQQQYKQELSGAFNLGILLFAEKPTCFCKRIEHYLKASE